MDVLADGDNALLPDRRAVVVELEGDTDHVLAGLGQQSRGDGESTALDMAATTRVPARQAPHSFALRPRSGRRFEGSSA